MSDIAEKVSQLSDEFGIPVIQMMAIADCMTNTERHDYGFYGGQARMLAALLSTREKLEQAESTVVDCKSICRQLITSRDNWKARAEKWKRRARILRDGHQAAEKEAEHSEAERVDIARAWALEQRRADAFEARIKELEQEMATVKLERDGYDAQLHMTVARLGGTVEGKPTARLNFLQRIDELRELEQERWIPVEERLPELPKNGIEASEDVIAAIIDDDGEIEWWGRACRCCEPRSNEWARDGMMLRRIPTHWRSLPAAPVEGK